MCQYLLFWFKFNYMHDIFASLGLGAFFPQR